MKELIGKSEMLLQQSLNQMNTIMHGPLRTTDLRFEQHDLAVCEIANTNKHLQYDALGGRQQQSGRTSAAASERTGHPEVRGLIHDNDIMMPEFPQKPESAKLFRRWWKDVAEYCERNPALHCCQILPSEIRGYKSVIESQAEMVKLFAAADLRLPSDRGGATLTQMWNKYGDEKELYRVVKFILKEKERVVRTL